MKETKIEWCDSTVNPTDFQCCGCELWNKNTRDCYAGRFAERRSESTTPRIDWLMKVKSNHRFVSYEPAWGPVDFSRWTSQAGAKDEDGIRDIEASNKIELIILGGQSGAGSKKHPFDVQWARDVKELCGHDDVNCFLKQLGSNAVMDYAAWYKSGLYRWSNRPAPKGMVQLRITHEKGGDWREWPADLHIREFPDVV